MAKEEKIIVKRFRLREGTVTMCVKAFNILNLRGPIQAEGMWLDEKNQMIRCGDAGIPLSNVSEVEFA